MIFCKLFVQNIFLRNLQIVVLDHLLQFFLEVGAPNKFLQIIENCGSGSYVSNM